MSCWHKKNGFLGEEGGEVNPKLRVFRLEVENCDSSALTSPGFVGGREGAVCTLASAYLAFSRISGNFYQLTILRFFLSFTLIFMSEDVRSILFHFPTSSLTTGSRSQSHSKSVSFSTLSIPVIPTHPDWLRWLRGLGTIVTASMNITCGHEFVSGTHALRC